MDKIFKLFKGEIKSVDEKTHEVTVVVSTSTKDRDNEVITPASMKKNRKVYEAHPILCSSHWYGQLKSQIGECKKLKFTDDEVIATFEYYVGKGNEEADWGFFLASKGIAAYSIGFIPKEWEDKDFEKTGIRREYTEVELIEISQVLLPSNRGAVQSRRDADDVDSMEKELCEMAVKSIADKEWKSSKQEIDYAAEDRKAFDAKLKTIFEGMEELKTAIAVIMDQVDQRMKVVTDLVELYKKNQTTDLANQIRTIVGEMNNEKLYDQLIVGASELKKIPCDDSLDNRLKVITETIKSTGKDLIK